MDTEEADLSDMCVRHVSASQMMKSTQTLSKCQLSIGIHKLEGKSAVSP
jgi:hypothetical protein